MEYYNNSIDALYGPRTEKALIDYVIAKGINFGKPEVIFKSILSQVSVPSSFKTPIPRSKFNIVGNWTVATKCSSRRYIGSLTLYEKSGTQWYSANYTVSDRNYSGTVQLLENIVTIILKGPDGDIGARAWLDSSGKVAYGRDQQGCTIHAYR